VNSASQFQFDDAVGFTADQWDMHQAVNLRAPALLSQAFARQVGGDGGLIVNMLDAKLAQPNPDFFSYTVSKFGLAGLTELSARAWAGRGIRVCGIAPGGTEAPPRKVPRNLAAPAEKSPQEQAWWREVEEQTKASSLLKRYGTLEEQAAAILFFASDEASYITGVTLPVGGGDLG
jgi:dihydroxycyclohexadiene carboxylate dehydrogenase